MVGFRLPKDKLKAHLLELKRESYVEEGCPEGDLLDCSLGTNPFGFPQTILKGLNLEDLGIGNYPDPFFFRLRKALTEHWRGRFKEEEVFVGSGSMGCLEKINKALIKEGSIVLGYIPQFTEYITEVRACGGVYEGVPLRAEDGFEFHLEEVMNRLSHRHSLLYIDNPNNPTGQVIPLEAIRSLLERAYKLGVVVVVDEAYGDFMDEENSALNLDYPNLVVVRSFSKGFGLAGLRVGYVVIKGEELRKLYSKVNLPFEISSLSEELALRALKETAFIKESRARIREVKDSLMNFLLEKGFSLSKTSPEVPIFLMWKEEENLHLTLKNKGILCVDGGSFMGLDSSYVRFRIPRSFQEFASRI